MQYSHSKLSKRKVNWWSQDTEHCSCTKRLTVSEELSDHEAIKQIITQDIYYKCHEHIHKVKLV